MTLEELAEKLRKMANETYSRRYETQALKEYLIGKSEGFEEAADMVERLLTKDSLPQPPSTSAVCALCSGEGVSPTPQPLSSESGMDQ